MNINLNIAIALVGWANSDNLIISSVITAICPPNSTTLLGDRELPPYIGSLSETKNARTNRLTFDPFTIEPGEYDVRLRVDGVDSIMLLKRKPDDKLEPPEFDPSLKVTIA